MNCTEIKDYFFDYVLGEIDPELQIQVNEHLAVCERCRGEVMKTEALIDDLKSASRFKPAPDIYGSIPARIRAPRSTHPRLIGIPRSVVFALGSFLLGIVLTRSIDTMIVNTRRTQRIEVRKEAPRKVPFSDTVEFYSVPAKNLARI